MVLPVKPYKASLHTIPSGKRSHRKLWKDPPFFIFFIGKSTISMAIFKFAFCMFTRPGSRELRRWIVEIHRLTVKSYGGDVNRGDITGDDVNLMLMIYGYNHVYIYMYICICMYVYMYM